MNLTAVARMLRRNMTDAERILWRHLRGKNLSHKFRRQCLVGSYVVDFVSFEKRLVVEVDGGQHAESRTDLERDAWLRSQGFKVLRFWNSEVFENLEGVLDTIREALEPPTPTLPHKGGGGVFSDRTQRELTGKNGKPTHKSGGSGSGEGTASIGFNAFR